MTSRLSVLLTAALLGLTHATTLCSSVRSCISALQPGGECPSLLPVPTRSFVSAIPLNSFKLSQYRRNVWVYDDGGYHSLILHSRRRLVMVDLLDTFGSNKPDGSRTRLSDAAERILNGTIPTRVDIVYSHAHFDHIGATTRFCNWFRIAYPHAKILIWGTAESQHLVQDSTSGRALRPNVIIGKRGRTLSLPGGPSLSMRIVGGHSQQDLLIHIAPSATEPGLAMLVDIAFPRWAPPFNLAVTQDFRKYIQAHKEILRLNFGLYVGGHIRTGDRADVKESLRYVQDLLATARRAVVAVTEADLIAAGLLDVFDPTKRAYGNAWFPFVKLQRKLQIDHCYRFMVRKWGCRIGAVDILARGHCFVALQFLLIDE